jgi:DNA processing protein
MSSPIPDDLDAWLRLSLTPGVGDTTARRLLAAFGLPDQVFAQSQSALRQVVTPAQSLALLTPPASWSAQCHLTRAWLAEAEGRSIVTLADAAYPRVLLEMSDPPLLLYLQGRTDLLAHPQCLAVVGSRNPTPQGELTAHDMSRALAAAGVCIVSGMALGVDGAAHSGALDAAGATIAVVGTGLDRVYPRRHLALAHRIAQTGLLVSEFALGSSPAPANFPKRNRIIAGLSQGTLVVEAALASGSLITARLAAEMGREVFAIPGSIHAPQAKGCHALIRQGAKLVETAQDVLEDMRMLASAAPVQSRQAVPAEPPALGASDASAPLTDQGGEAVPAGVCGPQASLLAQMGYHPLSLDALQARTGHAAADLQAWLMELELDGHIARVPGGLFQRLVRA